MKSKRRTRPIHMDEFLYNMVMLPGYAGIGPNAKDPDMFGVEIELEGRKVKTSDPDIATYWGQHADNSLRINPKFADSQTVEYVFQQPLNMKETEKALKMLFKYLNSKGVVVFDSYRTSIHVHVNCANDPVRTVVNFITLAMIFDELFVSQNGQTRIGNNFCLRTRDAEGQIGDLIQSITHYGDPCSAFNKNNRYSSVNLASLSKFGSIEFRSLECTTDMDRVMHWIGTIQAMKAAARKYANPIEIIGAFSQKGPLAFTTSNLGPYGAKYIAVEGYNEMLHTGMRLAQDFAFCSEWLIPDKNEEDIYARYGKKRPMKKMGINFANQVNQMGGAGLAQWIMDEQAMWGAPPPGGGMPQPVAAPMPPGWNENPAVEVAMPDQWIGEAVEVADDFPLPDPNPFEDIDDDD